MPISFDSERKIFKLDAGDTSYAFMIEKHNYLSHLYYGPELSTMDLEYLYRPTVRGFAPYPEGMQPEASRDVTAQEYSAFGTGDYRTPGFIIRDLKGYTATDPHYVSHKIYAGKPGKPGLPATFGKEAETQTLEILLRDDFSGVEFTLYYSVFEGENIIARSVKVANCGSEKVYIEKVSSCTLDFWDGDLEFLHLWGSHCRERWVEREKLIHGVQSVSSMRGLSSHQHNPFFALAEPGTDETHGRIYGAALLYSGNFLIEVEKDQFELVRTQIGINPENFEWELAPGAEFHAPEVILTVSDKGLRGMSHNFHNGIRNHLIRSWWKDRKRPILVNNWEGTYFNFNAEKLLNIARDAAALGIEMLVLDDGWFGHRNDDSNSLGDWFVFEEKLPGGLSNLVKEINKLGLKFGLWFEPEMISKDSELYRKHPDWVLEIPGRTRSLGRWQMVLDMSRDEVVDYLFDSICAILDSANIEYIKWDANRHLTEVASAVMPPERQKEVSHRYVLGMYRLHERLLERYPKLLIEGCSGGGGRFDAGMLYYVPQIWTSDDSDAIERLKIQYGTSLVYPCSTMGAHVSDCPNHQTARSTPFETRGIVALSGTFGYELDLNKMTQEERDLIKKQVADYHKYNHIVANGDLYRLTDPFTEPRYTVWMQVTKDKSEFLLSYVQARMIPHGPLYSVRLDGLDPARRYRNSETGEEFSGEALMKAGFMLPHLFTDGTGAIYHFQAV